MRQDGRSTSKILPAVERFRPERGHLVRRPPGDGPGFWRGAPGSYFDSESRLRGLRRLLANLVPGGYLFLGHSESLSGRGLGLRAVMPSVYTSSGVKKR